MAGMAEIAEEGNELNECWTLDWNGKCCFPRSDHQHASTNEHKGSPFYKSPVYKSTLMHQARSPTISQRTKGTFSDYLVAGTAQSSL